MKKTLITISATTALWAVVLFALLQTQVLFLLTRSDVLELIQFIAMQFMQHGGSTT